MIHDDLFTVINMNIFVTPRSRGYKNITATYIRRSKLPSHIR